jgi:predicted RNA binding protein YcfA (HicA-like mRNA interferase family)
MKEVNGKKFCKIIEAHGWVLQRIKGSHYIYGKKGEINKISVPVHEQVDQNRLIKSFCESCQINR